MTVKNKFTKEEFLKRCETIYEMGFVSRDTFTLMSRWLEAINRYEQGYFNNDLVQMQIFEGIMSWEKKRTKNFTKTLAGDAEGYSLIKIAAVLCHPCQKCAEDKNAWHTRQAFCEHKERRTIHG
jgi:hypothetical protein